MPSAGRSDAGGTTPQATAFDPWVTLLLAAALLSLLPSEYLRLSLRALRTLVLEPVLFFYLVVAVCPTIRTLRPLWIALLTCASAVAALAIAQVVTNVQTVEVEGVRRALGTYASPNHLGLYLGRALPFALAFALFSSRGRRGYAAAAAVLSLALLATFSLGAWLSGAASVVALLVIRARTMPVAPGRRLLLSTLLAGVAASAGGWLVLARLGVERVTSQLSLEGATATFRRQIWTSALAMLHDHPILGIGLDNFLYRYQLQYMLPTAWQEPNISHPHNWLLHFWLELGLLGAIALIGLLGTFARLAAARLRATIDPTERALVAGAGASMMGLAVHGAVDNSYFLVDLAILFWWHLAVVAVAHHAGQSSPTPS